METLATFEVTGKKYPTSKNQAEIASTLKVKRQWYNGFAQNCYELENDMTIFIDYDNKTLRIVKTIKR